MKSPEDREQRLCAVAWSELRHIDGDAANIPPLLRALFDDEGPVALRAASYLGYFLCQEGLLVYDSTREALPFLIEAAQQTRAETQIEVVGLLCAITQAAAGFLDPWRAVRGLRGADRILPGVSLARGSEEEEGVDGAVRRAMLAALPTLGALVNAGPADAHHRGLSRLVAAAAQSLAQTSERASAVATRALLAIYADARGSARLPPLVALKELGAADAIVEPDDRVERWIWLAATRERVGGLRSVLVDTAIDEADAFDALRVGLTFFAGLGGALLDVAPDLQATLAERWVHQMKARLVRGTAPPDWAPSLGPEALIFAFPGAALPSRLTEWQIDLLELFYRHMFPSGLTRGNHLTLLRRLGAPWLRNDASALLVAHGRAPLSMASTKR